jgi:hypothetical protein
MSALLGLGLGELLLLEEIDMSFIEGRQNTQIKHYEQETVVAPGNISFILDVQNARPVPDGEGPALVTKIENTAGTGVINFKLEFLEKADGSGVTYEIQDFNVVGNTVNVWRLPSWARFLRVTYTAVSGNGAFQADVTAISIVKA